MNRAKELARLTRYPLAPTAAADVVAAAALFGESASIGRIALAACGSICLYAAGMVQNDLADRRRDEKLHPDRPLVRHPELLNPARAMVVGLFVLGLLLASFADALVPALVVATIVCLYNFGFKRKFPHDAIVMGCARAANLSVGLVAAGATWNTSVFTYLAGYVLFIGGVTAASRAEDMEPAQTRRLGTILSFLPQVLALAGFASLFSWERSSALLVVFAVLLFSVVRSMLAGTREAAIAHVKNSLLTIFLLHVCCVWARTADKAEAKLWLPVVILLGAATFVLMRFAGRDQAAPAE
ncbi:MAG: UbiA family prenyltransferase [Planctomycetota bacterium]